MAAGEVATTRPAVAVARERRISLAEPVVFVLSIASALAFWEVISRTGAISQRDLPAMSKSFEELWRMMQASHFWWSFADTVRGWALGLGIATALAVPIGILLGSSDFAASAFRIPIEFMRPIPSAALIPLLFLTLGTNLKSEVFLATFGAFWPLLVQTMYGVRDVDPVAIETARSFGVGRLERLYRITLPSSVPYIATGLRISSTVSLILAFTAELFMGTKGLGQDVNFAQAYGLEVPLYALALATGFLGVAIHLVFTTLERRALRWHPSQRETT
jgi:ABC-type nitrate/sulfonate/bicarbonate transport system permease component